MQNFDLMNYRIIKKEIEHIKEILERFEAKLYSPRASELSDMPKVPPNSIDAMVNNYIKHEQLRNRYEELLGQLCEQQLRIENMIEKLEPIERELIRYRYFDGLKWTDVCKKINYSQKQTFRIHSAILQKLEKMTYTDT